MTRTILSAVIALSSTFLLVGCKADLKCGPLEVDEARRLCVCPNGGEYRDGLCYLPDGSVTPLDGGTVDDASAPDASAVDACAACECAAGDERTCGTDVGACSFGTQRCVDGAWGACEGATDAVEETCNDLDDDCDGDTDEGLATAMYYRDADGDTYGSDADTRIACGAPSGYVARGGDCVDANASVRPGQTEYFTVPITGARPKSVRRERVCGEHWVYLASDRGSPRTVR